MSAFDDVPPLDEEEFPPGSTKERPKANQALAPLNWQALVSQEPPLRRWAIKGWLGYGHATLLVGSGGIGKTLLAQQAGSALAIAEKFIDEIPQATRVLMWACEDDHDELWRRQVCIARHFKRGLEEFSNFTLVPRAGQDNALMSSEYGKPMFTGLERYLAEQVNDYRADVVILDNVAQLYAAGENTRHDVTKFLNQLPGILGGERALLLLAHPSRAQGSEFSGSGAWENVARTRLYLGWKLPDDKNAAAQGDEADQYRYLARRKANYSERDWRRFTYLDGTLHSDPIEASGVLQSIKAGRAERLVIAGLQKLIGMGIHATEGTRSANFLPTLLAEYKFDDGVPSRELTAAMRSLMTSGRLKLAKVGVRQNRTVIMGLVCDLSTD